MQPSAPTTIGLGQRLRQVMDQVVYPSLNAQPSQGRVIRLGAFLQPISYQDLLAALEDSLSGPQGEVVTIQLGLMPNPCADLMAMKGLLQRLRQGLAAGSLLTMLADPSTQSKILYQAYRRYGFYKIPPHQIREGMTCDFCCLPFDHRRHPHLNVSETTLRRLLVETGWQPMLSADPIIEAGEGALQSSYWDLLMEDPPFMLVNACAGRA